MSKSPKENPTEQKETALKSESAKNDSPLSNTTEKTLQNEASKDLSLSPDHTRVQHIEKHTWQIDSANKTLFITGTEKKQELKPINSQSNDPYVDRLKRDLPKQVESILGQGTVEYDEKGNITGIHYPKPESSK